MLYPRRQLHGDTSQNKICGAIPTPMPSHPLPTPIVFVRGDVASFILRGHGFASYPPSLLSYAILPFMAYGRLSFSPPLLHH